MLEEVIIKGPLSASEVARNLGLSRTTVHRAVHVLLQQGMLRYRLGGKSLVVSGNLLNLTGHCEKQPTALDGVSIFSENLRKEFGVHVEVGWLAADYSLIKVESSFSPKMNSEKLFESDFTPVLFSTFHWTDVPSVVERMQGRIPIEVDLRVFTRKVTMAKTDREIWDSAGQSLTFSMNGCTGKEPEVAVRLIADAPNGQDGMSVCVNARDWLFWSLDGRYESFALGGKSKGSVAG